MRCPFCFNEDTKVIESRQIDEGSTVRRRRECDRCARRFTTFEKYEDRPLVVVKKDGRREEFQRNKLRSGILRACEKRPVPTECIEEIIYNIEKNLRNGHDREVSSIEIGEAVMESLLKLDEVAYIRFASVYRQFKDIQRFLDELQGIMKRRCTNSSNDY